MKNIARCERGGTDGKRSLCAWQRQSHGKWCECLWSSQRDRNAGDGLLRGLSKNAVRIVSCLASGEKPCCDCGDRPSAGWTTSGCHRSQSRATKCFESVPSTSENLQSFTTRGLREPPHPWNCGQSSKDKPHKTGLLSFGNVLCNSWKACAKTLAVPAFWPMICLSIVRPDLEPVAVLLCVLVDGSTGIAGFEWPCCDQNRCGDSPEPLMRRMRGAVVFWHHALACVAAFCACSLAAVW